MPFISCRRAGDYSLYIDMLAAASPRTYQKEPLPEANMHERKGEYFRRYEFLDGRVREEKLSEVTGVEVPFRHYEIFTEYAIQRSGFRTGQKVLMGDSQKTPALLGAKAAATRAGARVLASVKDIFSNEEALGPLSKTAPSLLTLIVSNRAEVPKIINAIKVQQFSTRAGREVKIERILLVEEGKDIKGTEPLLAENIAIDDVLTLMLAEAEQIAIPLTPLNHHQAIEQPQDLRNESFVNGYRQQIALSEVVDQVGEPLPLSNRNSHMLQESVSSEIIVTEPLRESIVEDLHISQNIDETVYQPITATERNTDLIPEIVTAIQAESSVAELGDKHFWPHQDSDATPLFGIPESKLAVEISELLAERLTAITQTPYPETLKTTVEPFTALVIESPTATQIKIEVPRNDEVDLVIAGGKEISALPEETHDQEREPMTHESFPENPKNFLSPIEIVPVPFYEHINLAEFSFLPRSDRESLPNITFQSYLEDFQHPTTNAHRIP